MIHDLRSRSSVRPAQLPRSIHPDICALYDVGAHDGIHFLVMPHLEGETLAVRLQRQRGGLPLKEVLTIGAQIADGLDKSHRAGIVHRDLKPANVMLTKAGVKLLDFGLAKLRPVAPISLSGMTRLAATPATASGTILGTVLTCPVTRKGLTLMRADIWALAHIYEMGRY